MGGQALAGFLRHFSGLPDPRAANVIHRFTDMLTIAICAVICGASGWVDVETFGHSKLPWLQSFLELPAGIPSHDTFGRLFGHLDPDAFEQCFTAWTQTLHAKGQKLVVIDGKSIRRSFEHAWDKSGMAHLVSAFIAENRLSFAQVAADDSGELQAMRTLLGMLDLPLGSVVSIDAGGCHKTIAWQILEQEADYVLSVKENQPTLLARIKSVLDEAVLTGFQGLEHRYIQSVEGDHGRIETRRVWVTNQVEYLGREILDQWPGLASIVLVESRREQTSGQGPTEEYFRRYYISSLPGADAVQMAGFIRGRWTIENQLHWQLDVSFGEDQRRIRKDKGAENFSRLCRIALNLLQADKTSKIGIKARRLKAGWNEPYLLGLFTG
jgi:predicted transposase YbfD/YdcC